MKKILSLLTLLIVAIGTSWAQSDPTLSVTSSADMFKNYTEQKITLSSTFTPSNETSYGGYTVKVSNTGNNNGENYIEILSAGGDIEKITFSVTAGSNGATINPAILGWTSTEDVTETGKADYVNTTQSAGGSGKKKDISYVEDITYDVSSEGLKRVRFYRQVKNIVVGTAAKANYGNAGTTWVWGIKVWLKATGPKITTQPQSAAYATGDPIADLTVEATASAGDLEYQWYTCDDAEKTNAAAIDGATSVSYTPTAAGFYYVNVADDNGDLDSDVAQITISEEEAPTINVTGAPADDVVVGTEVILTATTTGTPTPTVTWYDGDTDEEITTGATYTVPTDVAGTFSFYAVASNGVEPDATSAVQTIVVKEQVAKPTLSPNGGYFQESQEVAIATTTEDATIQYSTDGGSTWIGYTEAFTVTETTTVQAKAVKAGYIDSETATATFTKVTLDPQVDVTGAASWDWSKFGTKEIKFTTSTTPAKDDYLVLSNVVNYGYCTAIGADFGNAQALNVSTEYAVRDYDGKGKGFFQGGHIKFNTTVPGIVTVKYSNTGSRSEEGDRRFLNVNGSNYGEGTMSSTAKDKTTSVDVAAGEVHIKGTLKSDGSDQYLRIYSIEFTPATSKTITIDGEAGVTTFVAPYDLDFTNVTELSAYAVTSIGGTSVATEKVGKVPAGTALLIKGETAEVPVAESADPITNLLLASTGAGVQGGDNIYAYSKTAKKFKKVASTVTIPVGKAYLNIEANTDTDALDIDFDGEATGVNGVAEAKAEVAPVKVIKNGKLYIGNYNVAGQLVK